MRSFERLEQELEVRGKFFLGELFLVEKTVRRNRYASGNATVKQLLANAGIVAKKLAHPRA